MAGWADEMVRAKYYGGEEPRRDPEEITEVLGSIIERVGGGTGQAGATLVAEWDAIVPERWREEARPVGIRGGVLLVEVSSGAAATLLRHDTAALLSRVSERFGVGVVEAVRVRVSGRSTRSKNP